MTKRPRITCGVRATNVRYSWVSFEALLGEVPYIIQGVFLLQNAVLSSLNDHCILKAIVILDLLIS